MPLGHLGVNVADLARAKSFYDTIMPLLGFEPFFDRETEFSYRPAQGKVGTWIFFYKALEDGAYSRHRPGLQHLASMSRGSFRSITRVITRRSFRIRTGSWLRWSVTGTRVASSWRGWLRCGVR